jgi:hypothetical protein
MKMYAVVEVWLHTLTTALDGGEWSGSHLNHFIQGEGTPGMHGIGGCVGPRAGLDAMEKREISSPRWELNPDSSAM